MTLKKILRAQYSLFLFLIILIALFTISWTLSRKSNLAKEIDRQRAVSLLSEMRRTSERLSFQASVYLLSGDLTAEKAYQEIKAIRDGEKDRASVEDFPSSYDKSEVSETNQLIDSLSSLKDRLLSLNWSKEERQYIESAYQYSDQIITIETRAMVMFKTADYEVDKIGEVLFSNEYKALRNQFNNSLNQAAQLLDKRTERSTASLKKQDEFVVSTVMVIAFILLAIALLGWLFTSIKLDKPLLSIQKRSATAAADIENISKLMHALSEGKKTVPVHVQSRKSAAVSWDETGYIDASIDTMVSALEEIRTSYDKLTTLLNQRTDCSGDISKDLQLPEGDIIKLPEVQEPVKADAVVEVRVESNTEALREAQEKLQESEAKFRNILDALTDAIIIYDTVQSKILAVNRRFCWMFGYSVEESASITIDSICRDEAPYTLEDFNKLVKKSLDDQQTVEWWTKDSGSKYFWVDLTIRPVNFRETSVILITIRDITSRKEMVENARDEEEKTAMVLKIAQSAHLPVKDFLAAVLLETTKQTKSTDGRILHRLNEPDKYELEAYIGPENGPAHDGLIGQVLELSESGFWSEAVREKKTILMHDIKPEDMNSSNFPFIEGSLSEMMIVPILDREGAEALLCLGGRTSGYTIREAKKMRSIMEVVWQLVRRKAKEDVLRSEGGSYRKYLEENRTAMFLVRPEDGVITYANPAAERMSGFNKEALAGMNAGLLFDLPSSETARFLKETASRENGDSLRLPVKHGDGRVVSALVEATPVEENGVKQLFIIVQDFDTLMCVDDSIRKSEDHYRSLVENIPDILMRVDRDNKFLFVNHSIWQLTNSAPEDFVGRTIHDIGLPVELCDFIEKAVLSVYEGGKPVETEYEFALSGEIRYHNFRVIPEYNQAGWIQSVLVIGHNITNQKLTDEDRIERLARTELLNSLSQELAGFSLNLDASLHVIVKNTAEHFWDICLICLLSEDGSKLSIKALHHPGPESSAFMGNLLNAGLDIDMTPELTNLIHSREPMVLTCDETDGDAPLPDGLIHLGGCGEITKFLAASMHDRGKDVGLIILARFIKKNDYLLDDKVFLQSLADRAALTISNSSLFIENTRQAESLREINADLEKRIDERTQELKIVNEKLLRLSIEDALTGIANRRHFDEVLEEEIKRASRDNTELTLVMCDVDYFKRYNDHNGHTAGDKCLQIVSEVLQEVFKRSTDLVARYGGEEFAAILPLTSSETAEKLAQMLRLRMVHRRVLHEKSDVSKYVTISIGVYSSTVSKETSAADFINKADEALYNSKTLGRNCVTVLKGVPLIQSSDSTEGDYEGD